MELSLNESLQKINILVNKESKSQTDIDFLNKDIEDREKKLQKQLEDIEEIKQEALKYKNQIKELKEQMDIIIDERNNLEQKLKLEIHENEVNLKIEKSKIKEYEKQMQNSNLKNDELIKDINDKYESLKKEYEELANTYNKQCSQINLIWKSLSPTEDIFDNKDLLSLKEYLENELSQKNKNITKNYKNILQQFKDSSIKQIEEKCKENERLKKNLNEIKEEYDEKEKKLVKLFDEKVKEIAERLQQQTEERKKVEDMRDQQVNEMKENYAQKIQTLQQKIYSLKENLHTLKENNKQEKRELENFISNTNNNNSLSKCSSSQLSLIPSPSQLNLLDIEKGDLNHNKEKNTIKKPNSNTHQSCLSEVNENNLRELKLQKVFNSSLKLNIQPNSLNRSLSNEIQEMRQRLNKNSDNDSAIKRKYLLEKDSYYLLENNDMMEGFKTTDMLKKKLLEFETKYT
ncbi:hypothetical protein H8356DRAFT_934918 [Neocallimastix lanati (nom. inval.)]|nr:hypothetical protein H8356DRAFT_934918 [Neocallimastix sp. JGI-2020a]